MRGFYCQSLSCWLYYLSVIFVMEIAIGARMAKDKPQDNQYTQKEVLQLKAKLADLEEQVSAISKSTSDAIVMMGSDGCISFWNSAAELIYGYTAEEAMGKNVHELIAPVKYKKDYDRGLAEFFKTGKGPAIGKTLVLDALTKDCCIIPVELSVTAVKIGKRWHAVAISRDISERIQVEKRLLLDKAVIETAEEAIVVTDNNVNIVDINPAFTKITGYSRDDILGQNPSFLRSGKHDEAFYKKMWHQLLSEGKWSGELWNRRKSGEIYIEWLSITSIINDNGLQNYIGIFSDISDRKEAEEIVKRQANVDVLTNLLNRRAFIERLSYTLDLCHRKSQQAALLFLDLDKFKEVNDTHGHLAGDVLLQEVSKRLKSCIRGSDTLSRFGGDEFAILLFDISDMKKIADIAKNMCDSIRKPIDVGCTQVKVSASIGIACYPDDGTDADTLLKNSDKAMYEVKNTSRDGYAFYKD